MILENMGIEFEIWPSKIEEITDETEPEKVCTKLAMTKAFDVATGIRTYNSAHPDITTDTNILVLGADTIVAFGNRILGKPRDEEEAFSMLKELSGETHNVYTGVSFVFMTKDKRVGEYSFCEKSEVTFYPLEDDEIKRYIRTGEPLDKAGAYGIQEKAAGFVKCISGDYYNVVGLPIARILQELKKIGVRIEIGD